MNKKLIRKMLTASGGPLRLKFTPEQIAYFESRGLPLGMNNSKNYREEGVLALLYQELEKARKELKITSRMEMKPVLVKKASKLGEKDLYKLQVNTAAGVVSPVDPVAEFFMYGNPTLKGAEALFKTGLLGAARYAPATQLGNYGRLYFVGNAFKNSFNGIVPTLTSQTTSLLYQPVKLNESGLTSLKFFEKKPSKISEAEKFGLNKHDRKALSINEQLALEDLAQYKNSGLYRLVFRVTPDWENFGWNLDRSNPSFLLLFVKDGKSMRGPWARVVLQTPTGKGVLAVNPEKNMAGYTSRSFPVPEGMNWAPGEANMMIEGNNGLKLILTAPRTDFFDTIVEKGSESIGEKLPNIIDKSIMKDFWINSRKALRPGTYLSGDNGYAPKGSELIEAFKKRQLHKANIKERPLNKLFVTRTGLSPDSYSSIIRQGNRDGSLRWGEGFNKWNNSAVENRFINEAFQKLLKGEITPEQYEEIFNNWSLNIGGLKLLWKDFNGHKIPIHPHPYIYAKKQGGKMNILEFLKNGNKIKKALWGTNLDIDNRSDTTRQGSGTMPDSAYGAADAPNTGGVLSLLDIFNTVKDTEPSTVTLPNGKQVTFPGVLTGTPTFLPTFGPGLLLQGRLVNYVMNPAEKAARADFLKSANEIKTLAGSGHIPKGVQGDWMYPTEILKKYKLKQFSTPVKQEVSNLLKITKLSETPSVKKTSSLRSKEYYSKKREDKINGVSKVRSRLVLNNKAQTTGDMRAANTGRPRRAARYNDLRTELEKDGGFWGRQYNKIRKKVALGKQGADSKEKEFLESYWNYKQKGVLNKEQNGGLLEFLKNGSGIHIKEKNKGSFTRWCGGNVTEECIRRGKNSSNPKIRRKATFADNARKWKHAKGGKAFVNGVSVLDSNPDAYKYVKKKVKMRLYGGLIPWEITWINNNPSITDANRIFKHNNSILLLTDEYNNLKLLELKKINEEALRYGSFLNEGLKLLFGYLNKSKTTNSTNSIYSNTTLKPKLVYPNGNQFEGGMLNTDSKTFFNL